MKRLYLLFFIFLVLISTSACSLESRQDKVLDSIGKYKSKQLWTHGEFQDYTDFGLYVYSSIDLNNNQYFSIVSEADIETIVSFVDNFEEWIHIFQQNDPNDKLVLIILLINLS